MDRFKDYDVIFSGLKEGKHRFTFDIDQEFFNLFETEQEFSRPRIKAEVLMDKHSTFMEFWINTRGTVELICDISNEPFDHEIENEINVLVKFGEEYDDSDIEVITIPQNSHAFNVAQLVYEDVMLSIPMKKVSPNLTEEDLKVLEQYSPEEESEEEENADPRWDALRNLKNKDN